LARYKTPPPIHYQFTYVAPAAQFEFFLTDNYVITLPLTFNVVHGGFNGQWTLASMADIRTHPHQIRTILEYESAMTNDCFVKIPFEDNLNHYCGTLYCTNNTVIITKLISQRLVPAFNLKSERPICAGVLSDLHGTWF